METGEFFRQNVFNGKSLYRRKRTFSYSLVLLFYLCLIALYLCLSPVAAQDEPPKDAAAPPLKILFKEEKAQLEAETEFKGRTKLALELMDMRLKKAEELNAQNDFNGMFTELGGFHAIMDNTLSFLDRYDNGSGKILNNFKRMELSLRGFSSRLEVIRRELPMKYEFYVRGLIKQVRDARTRAVEPMFRDTVVPNSN